MGKCWSGVTEYLSCISAQFTLWSFDMIKNLCYCNTIVSISVCSAIIQLNPRKRDLSGSVKNADLSPVTYYTPYLGKYFDKKSAVTPPPPISQSQPGFWVLNERTKWSEKYHRNRRKKYLRKVVRRVNLHSSHTHKVRGYLPHLVCQWLKAPPILRQWVQSSVSLGRREHWGGGV